MESKTQLNCKTKFRIGCLNRNTEYPVSKRDLEEVEACRKFIRLYLTHAARYTTGTSSYGLKHAVEHWLEACDRSGIKFKFENHCYVSNEAFIEAMFREGFESKPTWQGSPNLVFKFTYIGPKIFNLCGYAAPSTVDDWENILNVNYKN